MAFVHPLQKRTNVVEVLVVEAGIDGRLWISLSERFLGLKIR